MGDEETMFCWKMMVDGGDLLWYDNRVSDGFKGDLKVKKSNELVKKTELCKPIEEECHIRGFKPSVFKGFKWYL